MGGCGISRHQEPARGLIVKIRPLAAGPAQARPDRIRVTGREPRRWQSTCAPGGIASCCAVVALCLAALGIGLWIASLMAHFFLGTYLVLWKP